MISTKNRISELTQTPATDAESTISLKGWEREQNGQIRPMYSLPDGNTFGFAVWIQEKPDREKFLDRFAEQVPALGQDGRLAIANDLRMIARKTKIDLRFNMHGAINGRAHASIDLWKRGRVRHSESGNILNATFRQGAIERFAAVEAGRDSSRQKLRQIIEMISELFLEQIERARTQPHIQTPQNNQVINDHCPYYEDEHGILMQGKDGVRRLTHFSARILAEVMRDDGSGEFLRQFELEAKTRTGSARFCVDTKEFQEVTWPLEKLGTRGHVRPGQGIKECVRDAIVRLSGDPPEKRVHTCPGWIVEAENWHYLHASGVISANDSPASIDVDLDHGLANYELPKPTNDPIALKAALKASLRVLELTNSEIVYPVYSLIGRAPLGYSNFIVNLVGRTGNYKSELASLAARHFGKAMHAKNLSILWESTTNALGEFLFLARDTLGIMDDLKLKGSATDIARIHAKADTVFRWQGNGVGKGRMNAAGGLRAPHPPRGSILSTSELIPNGESCRGRGIHITISPGDIASGQLKACQRDAEEGLYALAMANYIRWLAQDRRIARIKQTMPELIRKYRERAAASDLHKRTPEIVADLYVGLESWLLFCMESAVITEDEERRIKDCGWEALGRMAEAQLQHQATSEPATRFIALLMSSLASGRGHLASAEGKTPPDDIAIACGWWRRTDSASWEPRSRDCIGYITNEGVFLIPDAAYAAACEAARHNASDFVEPEAELRNRLFEKGFLAGCEGGKFKRRTVRRWLGGFKQPVIWLKPEVLEIPCPEAPPPVARAPMRPSQPNLTSENENLDFDSEMGVDDAV